MNRDIPTNLRVHFIASNATFLRSGLVLLLLILLANPVAGQSPHHIGLALSGGGAKGFAHIGVLKVLEEINLPIDCIAGTSMGSIMGGLYAIGYTAAELESIVVSIDWDDMLSDRTSRKALTMPQKQWDGRYLVALPIRDGRIRLPSGVIGGHKISRLLAELTLPAHGIEDFSRFPTPFAAVTTDILSGKAVVFTRGFLPEVMRASMAIPSVFTPVKIGEHLLVDGGLVRNLPAQDARDLGADIVIGVDVSKPVLPEAELTSFLDIVNQATTFMGGKPEQQALCDVLILPELDDFTVFSFDHVTEIISRGELAARAKLPELQALMDSVAARDGQLTRTPLPRVDSFELIRIEIEGTRRVSVEGLLNDLNRELPGRFTTLDIERILDRIQSTQLFERATYRLAATDTGTVLHIQVVEKVEDQVRFALRFDNDNNASVLLNSVFRSVSGKNAYLNLDLKLGEQILFDGQYLSSLTRSPRLGFVARLHYNDDYLDVFNRKARAGRLNFKSVLSEVFFGTVFSTRAQFGFGVRAEFTDGSPQIGGLDSLAFQETLLAPFATLWVDSRDRAFFPTRGVSLFARSEVVDRRISSTHSFTRHLVSLAGTLPVAPRLALSAHLLAGYSSGAELPFHYQFVLGGLDTPVVLPEHTLISIFFPGTKSQELLGRHAQFGQLAAQLEFMTNTYLIFRFAAGNTFDRWRLDLSPGRFISGAGITLAANTLAGPVELSLMGGSQRDFLTHFRVGLQF